MQQKGRNWIGTLNNPDQDPEEYLLSWSAKAVYVCGQLERGENGTEHIQFFLNFANTERLAALKKHCPKAHFQIVKINNGAHDYCMKVETRVRGPWEFGVKPRQRNNATDWESVWSLAKQGKIEEIPADIRTRCYFQLKSVRKDYQVVPQRTQPKKCFWYYGPPRTGKTRKARTENPQCYLKQQTRWWCGYTGESVVLMDDLGFEAAKQLVDNLKLWADPWYNQPGENKGGAVVLLFDVFIVTSNYHIKDLGLRQPDEQALLARFELVPFGVFEETKDEDII